MPASTCTRTAKSEHIMGLPHQRCLLVLFTYDVPAKPGLQMQCRRL